MISFSEIKKVAVFRALYLGDMLCIIPAVRAIRAALPKAEITLIGLPWQKAFAQRFSHYFDQFMEFPGWPGLPEQAISADKVIRFQNIVSNKKFDLIFQMHGNGFITNNLCSLWGSRFVCGLRTEHEQQYTSEFFPLSEDTDHEILRFFKLTDVINIPPRGTELEFPISDAEFRNYRSMAQEMDIQPHDYICIHPGARDVRRRWPPEHFAFVANRLAELGNKIVLTGSADEKELLDELRRHIAYPVLDIVHSFGNVPVGELAAFICCSKMLISNDTGVSHIAAALRVPSVIIFSAYSSMQRWAPLNDQLHLSISREKASDPEYILYRILSHLEKCSVSAPVLFNNK